MVVPLCVKYTYVKRITHSVQNALYVLLPYIFVWYIYTHTISQGPRSTRTLLTHIKSYTLYYEI